MRLKEYTAQRQALKERLLTEHGVAEHPKGDKLFELAWDLGHAYGEQEVALYLADLAELLK